MGKIYKSIVCFKSVSIHKRRYMSRNTKVYEVWVSYPDRMGSSNLCGKKMVPQSASPFKRALNKTEMYPPPQHLCQHGGEVFSTSWISLQRAHTQALKCWDLWEAVSILEKVPIMQRVYAHGELLSISSEFSSAQRRRENRGTFLTRLPISCMARSVLVPEKSQADICM